MNLTRRLVTQNLIVSAIAAERSRKGATWAQVSDLAALIDAYCLFDEIHFLGRSVNVVDRYRGSRLSECLEGVLVADYLPETTAERVRAAAGAHLRSRLPDSPESVSPKVISDLLTAQAITGSLHYSPDGVEDFDWGEDWVQAELTSAQAERLEVRRVSAKATSFFIRTFLYLAYADVAHIPLTADSVRAERLGVQIEQEESLAGDLLATLKGAYKKHRVRQYAAVRERVSPLAAIVFERAASQGRPIADEMARLREDLTSLRNRIRVAESEMLDGSYAQAQVAERKWREAFDELARTYGSEPEVVRFGRALSFGQDIAHLADEAAKYSSWAQLLLSLPAEVIRRLVSRRPLIEVHDLRQVVPASARLARAVETLFGEIA